MDADNKKDFCVCYTNLYRKGNETIRKVWSVSRGTKVLVGGVEMTALEYSPFGAEFIMETESGEKKSVKRYFVDSLVAD